MHERFWQNEPLNTNDILSMNSPEECGPVIFYFFHKGKAVAPVKKEFKSPEDDIIKKAKRPSRVLPQNVIR